MTPFAVEHDEARAKRERAMTSDREETKYVLHPLALPNFLRSAATELTPHRYMGKDGNRLPEAEHFSTTVYFDTAQRHLYHAARCNPLQNTKLRARAYYDVHSSLAELSTSMEQFVRCSPALYLELKQRDGVHTAKHRVQVERAEVLARLEALREGQTGEPQAADIAAIAAFCADLGAPLQPSCVVNYRRIAFEDASALLRVTVDVDVSFFAPSPDPFRGPYALLRQALGPPRGAAHGCLLEVKQRAGAPAWLSRALEDAGARRDSFSKFMLASEAVHEAR